MPRKPWSSTVIYIKEDKALDEPFSNYGPKVWPQISQELSLLGFKGRTAKQFHKRWRNRLDPTVTKSNWTAQEPKLIFKSAKIFVNKWAFITKKLPGRTDHSVKNFYYGTVIKNIRRVNKSLF